MREPLPRLPAEGTANVLFQRFRTQTAIRELMQGVIAGTGVSGEEYAILGVVHFFPDRTPTELAARARHPADIGFAPGRRAPRQEAGRAPPNPEDGRSYLLRTTAEGQQGRADDRAADRRARPGDSARSPTSRSSEIAASLASLEQAIKNLLATGR